MKVAQINAVCGIASTGRTSVELAQDLEEKGHSSHVFYSYGKNTYPHATRIGSTPNRKLHALLSRITGLQGYFSYLPTLRLIRQLKQYQPDVVHLRNLHANYIHLKTLFTYLAKYDIPTVITLHDCWLYTGKCTHYIGVGCEKWRKECGQCPLLHIDNNNPTLFFDTTRKCLRDKKKWLDAIPRLGVVGVSQWVAQEAANGSILADRQPETIYNWIDLDVFHPTQSNLRKKHQLEDKFVILVVASLISKTKCLDEIQTIAAQMPPHWAIVAIGQTAAPLPDGVIHIPQTDNTAMLADYYSMADVCLNTTHCETFGKVTAESMCCGTPVVVYNNTASPELVADGCGEVVEQAKGIDAVMEALRKVEQAGKQQYSATCVQRSYERFSKDTGVSAYIALYERLINS